LGNLEKYEYYKKIKEKANKIKNDIPAIHLALKKKETPIIAKILSGIIDKITLSSNSYT
jgi:hypothetical protein